MTATPHRSKRQRRESSEIPAGRPNSPPVGGWVCPGRVGNLDRGIRSAISREVASGVGIRVRWLVSFRPLRSSAVWLLRLRRKIHPKGRLDEAGLDPTAQGFHAQWLRGRGYSCARHVACARRCLRRIHSAARRTRVDQAVTKRCAARGSAERSAEHDAQRAACGSQCAPCGSEAARGRAVEAGRPAARGRSSITASVRRAASISSRARSS
jgi:hypothetical protein